MTLGRAGIRTSARALVACLCAIAVVASIFAGSVRSSAAATEDRNAILSIVSVATQNVSAKKLCQRGNNLGAAGALCSSGVFVGVENSTAELLDRSSKQARIAPVLRSPLATQCCATPHLRPPKTDA